MRVDAPTSATIGPAVCAPTVRAAETAPASVAGETLALCHEADPVTGTERTAVLPRGLDRVAEAVSANPGR
jgi:hypothetical protein